MASSSSSKAERWLLGVGCGLRILFFLLSHGNGGDAFLRAAITAQWLQHPSLGLDFAGPRRPPLHFWLMALVAQIVPDILLACRLLSLTAGLVSLWLFWKLSRRLFGESAALLSLTVFVFYSLHIAYATTSSSEETYLAFLLGGLLGVFSFRALGRFRYLLAGGLSLTAAAAIRFEAWILIFGLGILFLLGQEGRRFPSGTYWKALSGYALTSGAWPIFWTIRSWILTGHAFYGLSDNKASIPGQLAVFPEHGALYEFALTPGVILVTLTPIAIIGTLYGVWLSFREKKGRGFALLVLFFAAFQFLTIATHGTIALARYTLTLGTLCAVLAGYGLARLGEFFRLRRQTVLATLIVLMAANLALIVGLSRRPTRLGDKLRSISPLMQFAVHLEDLGTFLRPRLQSTDHLIIDNFNNETNLVSVVIGLPLLTGDRFFTADFDAKEANPFPYINSYHPRYAILSPWGTIGPTLGLPPACSEPWTVQGLNFRCLHENEIYRVYEISYGDSSSTAFPTDGTTGVSHH